MHYRLTHAAPMTPTRIDYRRAIAREALDTFTACAWAVPLAGPLPLAAWLLLG